MRRENTGAAGWKRAGVFAGMAVLAAVLSGCGNGAEADFSLRSLPGQRNRPPLRSLPGQKHRPPRQRMPGPEESWRRPPETGGWPGQRQRII